MSVTDTMPRVRCGRCDELISEAEEKAGDPCGCTHVTPSERCDSCGIYREEFERTGESCRTWEAPTPEAGPPLSMNGGIHAFVEVAE